MEGPQSLEPPVTLRGALLDSRRSNVAPSAEARGASAAAEACSGTNGRWQGALSLSCTSGWSRWKHWIRQFANRNRLCESGGRWCPVKGDESPAVSFAAPVNAKGMRTVKRSDRVTGNQSAVDFALWLWAPLENCLRRRLFVLPSRLRKWLLHAHTHPYISVRA